jgi:hypothetical protein
VSFERQVAAFLGSMSEEVPAGRYAPPRTMLRRANIRMTGTLGLAALAVGLICLGAVLLSHSMHGATHQQGRIGGPNDVMMSAQAAAYAADSITGAAAGWVDGTLHHRSTSLGLAGAGGFTRLGGYGSNVWLGGPSGDNVLRGWGHGGSFGPPGADRGSGGGSGGGAGGGSGGPGDRGESGSGDPSGRGGGGRGDGPGHDGRGGIGPDFPGAPKPPPWFEPGLPLQGMDIWLGPSPAGPAEGGSPTAHEVPGDAPAGAPDGGSPASTDQSAQSARAGSQSPG